MVAKCIVHMAIMIDTNVFTFSKVVGISKEKDMSAKQGIHKGSLMKKYKYGCQINCT